MSESPTTARAYRLRVYPSRAQHRQERGADVSGQDSKT